MKPMIGVLPLWDDEKESLWMLPGYFEGIKQAGGLPIMLPLSTDPEEIKQCVEMCDGFLFTGGHDVSPYVYHKEARVSNLGCCQRRDEMELILLEYALQKKKPILGICRGIQFLNAAMGGTLYQDLPTEHPSSIEHHQKPPYDIPIHEVEIMKDSPLFSLLGQEKIMVNSYHHQAVMEMAPSLVAMAKSSDGLVEAVFLPTEKFVWAVQWHPEFSYQVDEKSQRIFEAFVKAMEK